MLEPRVPSPLPSQASRIGHVLPGMGAAIPDAADPSAAAPTVLVLDDDELARTMIARYLECHGFRVVSVADGWAGLAAAAAVRPDVIVTDWQMPCLDGIAFTSAIRDDARFDGVPIVLFSGASRDDGYDVVSEFENVTFVAKRDGVRALAGIVVSRLTPGH